MLMLPLVAARLCSSTVRTYLFALVNQEVPLGGRFAAAAFRPFTSKSDRPPTVGQAVKLDEVG